MKTLLFALLISSLTAYQTIEDQSGLTILTPSLKDRKMEKIRLDNGLEALLISDPQTDQSAAAMAFGVGSWSDPKEYPGTAHFVEHMLFLGTEKYPKEDAFFQSVQDAGGMLNAYTAPDRTVYMFSCTNNSFGELVDEFSHMFIDPLMRESSVGRELLAVNQENEKNRENDGWRGWMIFKEMGNQDHPNAKFSTGNADTLGKIPVSRVKEWFETNYSSDQAHLVLYSNLSIDELAKIAESHFTAIPNRESAAQLPCEKMSSTSQMGHITYITPVHDMRSLSLMWELPKELGFDDESKSMHLIAYALRSKGEHSLFTSLNKEGLANDVSASTYSLARGASFFSIDVDLTPEGVAKLDGVLKRCFEALASLNETSLPPYLYTEMATMQTVSYAYQGRENAFSFVRNAGGEVVEENLATYPRQTLLPAEFNQKKVDQGLALLAPDTCLFTVTASPSLTGVTPDRKEKWLGGEYVVKPLDERLLTKLREVDPSPHLGAPDPNPFIPYDIKTPQADTHTPLVSPEPVVINSLGTLYYAKDTYYHVPEVSWIVEIKSPLIDDTPDQAVLLDLFIYALHEKLAPFISNAARAGLQTSFSHSDFALRIDIDGYAQKAPELLDVIVYGLKTLSPTHDEFTRYKTALLSRLENQMMAMPFKTANEIGAHALYNNVNRAGTLHSALQDISYESFIAFSSSLLKRAFMEGTFVGDLSEKEARKAWKKLESGLNFDPFSKREHFQKEVVAINSPYRIDAATNMQGNAALLVIGQAPFSYEKKASQLTLDSILSTAFFETLRTKQQTGYIAKGWSREVAGELMECFAVQSTTHEPSELIARFELFLEEFVRDFETHVSSERFEAIKAQLITTLSTPATNLAEKTAQLHELGYTYHGDFSRNDSLIASLNELTYEQLKSDCDSFFSRKNPSRLAIQLEGSHTGSLRYETITADALRRH